VAAPPTAALDRRIPSNDQRGIARGTSGIRDRFAYSRIQRIHELVARAVIRAQFDWDVERASRRALVQRSDTKIQRRAVDPNDLASAISFDHSPGSVGTCNPAAVDLANVFNWTPNVLAVCDDNTNVNGPPIGV
jgi:hypothetical protein